MSARALGASLVGLTLALAAPALAHETLHEIQRGTAIAVKTYFADGEVLAYTPYEIYSPNDPKIPWQKGRTDRSGWVAFVPAAPGKWRVKVIDDTGHGLDVQLDASETGAATTSALAGSSAAFVLRPLVGLVVIGAVFAALYAGYRRKGTAP